MTNSIQSALSDPRTGKFLRGSQVLDWLASFEGGLGVVVVKEGWEDWRRECEKFFFSEDDSAQENCPPGTGFYLGAHTLVLVVHSNPLTFPR